MANGQFSAGANLNSVPLPQKQTLATNYLDLANTANQGWAQQYLPDLMEKEAEVFGNRTIGGFLEMVGAEEPMTADQVVWSEQGRLHFSYKGNLKQEAGSTYDFTMLTDADWGTTLAPHGVRVGDVVIITGEGGSPAATKEVKAYVTAIGTSADLDGGGTFFFAPKITVAAINEDGDAITNIAASSSDVTCSMLVIGSEYGKATQGRVGANTPTFKSFSNQPIIIKDKYEVSGSDVSQIGWVEVTGEDGQGGYLWYLKAAGDTKSRFADYVEMMMIEGELLGGGAGAITGHRSDTIKGTEGFFAAVRSRGNAYNGLSDTTTDAAQENLDDMDALIALFDEQGAIEEYMMFLNRATSLRVDDMLAGQNSYGSGGTSYGVFDNSEDMALNLGFSGFRRASYDFYKTDWKYLNDKGTRGGLVSGDDLIRGCFVPAGVTTVYDQSLGKNLKRPFLHVRYRASNMDDRRFKTWTTGSVGAATTDLDAMEMHFLSERCLVTQGANNFVLLEGIA
jgi:hypothetical protein